MKKRKVEDESFYSIFGWMTNPEGLNLCGLELSVYAIIYGFSQGIQWCQASTEYMAQFTGATDRGIRKAIDSLVSKKLIVKKEVGHKRYNYMTTKKKSEELSSASEELSSASEELSSAYNIDNIDNNIVYKRACARDNTKKPKCQPKIKRRQVTNFSQRDYDFQAIEAAIINRPIFDSGGGSSG